MRLELDSSSGMMTINGIDIHFDVLDRMTKARPEYVYQFRRVTKPGGEVVEVRQWRIEDVIFPAQYEPMSPDPGEK